MKRCFIPILAILIISFYQCRLETHEPQPASVVIPKPCDTCLPEITTSGKNTFGCRVNGKLWLPKSGFSMPGVYADVFGNSVSIQGFHIETNELIALTLAPITDTGLLVFPSAQLTKSRGYFANNKDHLSDPVLKGWARFLRVDYANGVFSGTFGFDTYSYDKKDTVHITEGMFDIRK